MSSVSTKINGISAATTFTYVVCKYTSGLFVTNTHSLPASQPDGTDMIRLNTRIPYSRLGNYRPAWDLRLLFKVLVVVLVVVVLRALFMQPVQQYLREGRSCFQHSASFVENSIAFFPDIVRAERQPTPSKTIFFTETSCCGDGFVRLNARYVATGV